MLYINKIEMKNKSFELWIYKDKNGKDLCTLDSVKSSDPWLLSYLFYKYDKLISICFLDGLISIDDHKTKQLINELIIGYGSVGIKADQLKKGKIQFIKINNI